MICPEGLQYGIDFCNFSQCDNCEDIIYRKCRTMSKTCGEKVPFTSWVIARYEARQLGLTIYKCPYCGFFHMSSSGE
jgi:predicted RNA-binding Zn-ribbon protein involved in translation (DUF1610 family)